MIAPAGHAAAAIAEVGVVLAAGGTIIFIATMVLAALALQRRFGAPRRAVERAFVIGGGIVFPVAVLSALLVYSAVRSANLDAANNIDAPVISVTAKMWWWEVRYRDPRGDVVLANEIRLPLGRPVTLGLTTADVIHSFWVPALAGKVDMVPGRVHQLRVEAQRAGVFRGQCAEYCGEQHAKMALHVVVLAPEDFELWLDAQQQPATAPRNPTAETGLRVFEAQRCDACHTVRGLTGTASLGPDLTHIGSRLHLGAGSLPRNRDSLREWVAHIQRIKPGARMPGYERLDSASLIALAAFLDELE